MRASPQEIRGFRQRLARLGSVVGRAFELQGSLTPAAIYRHAMRDVKQQQANDREPGDENDADL